MDPFWKPNVCFVTLSSTALHRHTTSHHAWLVCVFAIQLVLLFMEKPGTVGLLSSSTTTTLATQKNCTVVGFHTVVLGWFWFSLFFFFCIFFFLFPLVLEIFLYFELADAPFLQVNTVREKKESNAIYVRSTTGSTATVPFWATVSRDKPKKPAGGLCRKLYIYKFLCEPDMQKSVQIRLIHQKNLGTYLRYQH